MSKISLRFCFDFEVCHDEYCGIGASHQTKRIYLGLRADNKKNNRKSLFSNRPCKTNKKY